jgi:hypothetical protein
VWEEATSRRREERANGPSDEGAARKPAPSPVEQLKELHELREQGILSEEEFAAEKKKLLGP